MSEDGEMLKAQQLYEDQVKAFRTALNAGKRSIARDLADEYDWSYDMLIDELSDWYHS